MAMASSTSLTSLNYSGGGEIHAHERSNPDGNVTFADITTNLC